MKWIVESSYKIQNFIGAWCDPAWSWSSIKWQPILLPSWADLLKKISQNSKFLQHQQLPPRLLQTIFWIVVVGNKKGDVEIVFPLDLLFLVSLDDIVTFACCPSFCLTFSSNFVKGGIIKIQHLGILFIPSRFRSVAEVIQKGECDVIFKVPTKWF